MDTRANARPGGRCKRRWTPPTVLVLFVSLVAGSVVGAGPASAATAPKLWTYSGVGQVSAEEYALARLIQMRPSYCPPGKPIPSAMTLDAALASAHRVVVDLAGVKAVSAFERSATARSAVESRAAAVGMFAGKKTVASLLTLLRTHQLTPNDPSILSSISALLNILGRPKESLAIARAADAMKAAPAVAMGISGQAMLLNNEGHAMLGLRRWADAERLLRQAATLAPELSEARINLAIALLCQHEDEDAVKFFRAGTYRKAYHLVKMGDEPTASSAPEADEVLDLSHGADGMFPEVRIPPTWDQNNGSLPGKAGLLQWGPLFDEYSAFLASSAQLDQQLSAKVDWQNLPPGVSQRFSQLLGLAYSGWRQPGLKPLNDKVREIDDQLDTFIAGYGTSEHGRLHNLYVAKDSWPECHGPTSSAAACNARWSQECSTFNSGEHAKWLPIMTAYDRALRDWYRADYRYETGVIANIADPLLHRIAYVRVHRNDWGSYYSEVNQLARWATYLGFSNCNPSAPTEEPKVDDGTAETSPPCPKFLEGVKLSVKLGDFVKFKTNCEQVSLEVASKSDVLWVGGFAEGSYNFVKGTGTIFAGIKGGGKIPETGVQVSAKEGLYLTIGSEGIRDAGMRVTTAGAYGLASGPAVEMKGFGYQISFVSQTITF